MKKGTEKTRKNNFYKTNPSGGISLIVLVITIIVVIILAAMVIISLQNNNPMSEANEARIKSDVANMQAIFTNTVGKIMAYKQEVIEIEADKLNEPTSTGKSVVGEAVYKIEGKVVGKIIFDNKENNEENYYTGRKLPVYSKETTWYVDENGILRLEIGDKTYGEGQIKLNESIKISTNVIGSSDYKKATLEVVIEYEGEIDNVTINGERVEVVKNEEEKYVGSKEVVKNGSYIVEVTAKDGSKNKVNINVNEIAGDMSIYNREDMEKFRDMTKAGVTFEGNNIKVKEDIDLGGSSNNFEPIYTFKGEFDGENHTIGGLYINREEGEQALFKKNEGTIKNIVVKGEVTGNGEYVAGICSISSGKIDNCTNYANITNNTIINYSTAGVVAAIMGNNGSIVNSNNYGRIDSNSDHVGGVIGHINSNDFIVDNCNNYGKIQSTQFSGGVLGSSAANGIIKNCNNFSDITSLSKDCAGGIIGVWYGNESNEKTIQNCINIGKIQSEIWGAGGILGNSDISVNISNCRNEGEVFSKTGNCGGILGSLGKDDSIISIVTISNCVNKGYIHASGNNGNPSCAGVIATIQFGDKAIINNCYNTGNIAATSYISDYIYHGVGGIVGSIYNNSLATSEKSKVTVSNCYNIGNITNSYDAISAGQILGVDWNNNRTITNCFYLDTVSGNNTYGGVVVNSDILKNYATQLGIDNWKNDEKNINLGYPILKWE